jgi:hypothetical protein
MRHVGKGGSISSLFAQTEETADKAEVARSNAFTRACRAKNLTKVQRMLSSGSFEVQQEHVAIAQGNVEVRELLLRSAIEMNGISISQPRCPKFVSMPQFLVDYILEGESTFVVQRSGRFTCVEHGIVSAGTLNKDMIFKLFRCLEGHEMREWIALSRAFAFGLCDTAQFAKLYYQNTFAICYATAC